MQQNFRTQYLMYFFFHVDFMHVDSNLCDIIKKESQVSPGILPDDLVADIKNITGKNLVQNPQDYNGSSTNLFNKSESQIEDEKVMFQHGEENV